MPEEMYLPSRLESWMALGNCYNSDEIRDWQAQGIDIFYDKTVPPRIAKRFCNHCFVKQECFNYAVENSEAGIWGGKTERERREMKRRLNRRLRQFLARTGHEVLPEPMKELLPGEQHPSVSSSHDPE